MDEKKAEICDEILLDNRKSDMEDVKNEGNAAGDANAKNDEKDDNILQDFHRLAVTVKD